MIQWLATFHWVRDGVRVRVYTIERVCQPCCRKSGKVPSLKAATLGRRKTTRASVVACAVFNIFAS